jgi:hypothetical protein
MDSEVLESANYYRTCIKNNRRYSRRVKSRNNLAVGVETAKTNISRCTESKRKEFFSLYIEYLIRHGPHRKRPF